MHSRKTEGEDDPVTKMIVYKPKSAKESQQTQKLEEARKESPLGPSKRAWP